MITPNIRKNIQVMFPSPTTNQFLAIFWDPAADQGVERDHRSFHASSAAAFEAFQAQLPDADLGSLAAGVEADDVGLHRETWARVGTGGSRGSMGMYPLGMTNIAVSPFKMGKSTRNGHVQQLC